MATHEHIARGSQEFDTIQDMDDRVRTICCARAKLISVVSAESYIAVDRVFTLRRRWPHASMRLCRSDSDDEESHKGKDASHDKEKDKEEDELFG